MISVASDVAAGRRSFLAPSHAGGGEYRGAVDDEDRDRQWRSCAKPGRNTFSQVGGTFRKVASIVTPVTFCVTASSFIFIMRFIKVATIR